MMIIILIQIFFDILISTKIRKSKVILIYKT